MEKYHTCQPWAVLQGTVAAAAAFCVLAGCAAPESQQLASLDCAVAPAIGSNIVKRDRGCQGLTEQQRREAQDAAKAMADSSLQRESTRVQEVAAPSR